MSDIPPQVIENILADLDESARLRTLSNEELVMECIRIFETDCPVVDEMCDRLFPGWANAVERSH